jgi:SAM-dependent methyltransferase
MRQNVYDDPRFFDEYARMRERARGLQEAVIVPWLPELLPDLTGKSVVDLGCGDGWFCRYAADAGAGAVVGVDSSARMLQLARERRTDARISYLRAFAEDVEFPAASADVVVSILALHYVADLDPVLAGIAAWLDHGGAFVEIVEHPIFTSQRERSGWMTVEGRHLAWPVSDYVDEGARTATWFVDGVVRYHRTLATIVNGIRSAGLTIDQVVEPRPTVAAVESTPEWADELIRPAVLGIRAVNETTRTRREILVVGCARVQE